MTLSCQSSDYESKSDKERVGTTFGRKLFHRTLAMLKCKNLYHHNKQVYLKPLTLYNTCSQEVNQGQGVFVDTQTLRRHC